VKLLQCNRNGDRESFRFTNLLNEELLKKIMSVLRTQLKIQLFRKFISRGNFSFKLDFPINQIITIYNSCISIILEISFIDEILFTSDFSNYFD
jgi:hypothetical protein